MQRDNHPWRRGDVEVSGHSIDRYQERVEDLPDVMVVEEIRADLRSSHKLSVARYSRWRFDISEELLRMKSRDAVEYVESEDFQRLYVVQGCLVRTVIVADSKRKRGRGDHEGE